MDDEKDAQINFFSEISEHQILAREFFSTVLLDYLHKNFGWKEVLISYYDTQGEFLSWTSLEGNLIDCKDHPYREFAANDVVRHVLYQDAVRDRLTYFNVIPRVYKSTAIITQVDYEHSAYVRFIEENFQKHYSATMAFGINAYIQVAFFKELEEGDFLSEELVELNEIYVYLATAYRNFKKYEQAKIVQKIQSEIIASGEKAYLIMDDFMHIMNYSKVALLYLKDILGGTIAEQISSTAPCSWLGFLMGNDTNKMMVDSIQTRFIKNYLFKIHTYYQSYSNGIVDQYHWITITKNSKAEAPNGLRANLPLTLREQRVAEFMYNGLTYKEIAREMVVSYHTIKKHVQNIYIKCGVNSRFELCRWLENRELE